MSAHDDRMAWSGTCDECMTVVAIFANEEATTERQAEISNEWPDAGNCYVQDCEGSIDWNGNDEVGYVFKSRML